MMKCLKLKKYKATILWLNGERNYIKCRLKNSQEEIIERAEYVYGGTLLKVDVFTYTEYYAPKDR